MAKKVTYRVDINWHEYGFIDIEADSADEAEDIAIEKMCNGTDEFFCNKSDFDICDIQINP